VRERYASPGSFPLPAEAVRQTEAAIRGGATPVVLADYWDRPGDGTWTLKELVDRGVGKVLYAALTDGPALDAIWEQTCSPARRSTGRWAATPASRRAHPCASRARCDGRARAGATSASR
jgi:hypothetical protein